jgi:hypothetical protein
MIDQVRAAGAVAGQISEATVSTTASNWEAFMRPVGQQLNHTLHVVVLARRRLRFSHRNKRGSATSAHDLRRFYEDRSSTTMQSRQGGRAQL